MDAPTHTLPQTVVFFSHTCLQICRLRRRIPARIVDLFGAGMGGSVRRARGVLRVAGPLAGLDVVAHGAVGKRRQRNLQSTSRARQL